MLYKKIVLQGKQKIFFTSDLHFSHKNICRGTTEWDMSDPKGHLSLRDFDNPEQMNDHLIAQINGYVGEDDWLIHLGDWSFSGETEIKLNRDKINSKNVVSILGNHDHHLANKKEHQDLFESVHSYLELTVSSSEFGKQTYSLCHFPLKIWNKAHHNRIMLFGHVHGSLEGEGRSLDVGIDNAFKLFGEYRPFSQQDISDYMVGREFKQISHHNKNTN